MRVATVSSGMFDGQGGTGWGAAPRRDVPLPESGSSDALSLHSGEARAGLQARQGLAVCEVGAGQVAPAGKPGGIPEKTPLRRRVTVSRGYLCQLGEESRVFFPSGLPEPF